MRCYIVFQGIRSGKVRPGYAFGVHLFQVKPKRKKHIQASLIPLLILKIIFDRELLAEVHFACTGS